MAVVRVALKDMPKGSATAEPNGLLYEIVRRKYTLEFLVYTNNFRDTQIAILTYSTLPHVGDTFTIFGTTDALATCVSSDARRIGPFVWIVTAEFDTDRVVSAVTDNPLNQPADISYQVVTIERPAIRDKSGLLIKNSAGEPYDPPVMELIKVQQVHITQNLATYNVTTGRDYVDSVNETTYQGQPGYTVKVSDRNGRRMMNRGIFYYQVNTVLDIDPRSFAEFILDQGFRDYRKQLFRDPLDFSIPASPTLMNGRGRALRDAHLPLAAGMDTVTTALDYGDIAQGAALFPPLVTIVGGKLVPPYWYFFVRIDDEVMKVVSGVLNVWTVERAAGGTTAAAHAAGATVQLEPYFLFYRTKTEKDLTTLALPTF